jgi:hypothetical protein
MITTCTYIFFVFKTPMIWKALIGMRLNSNWSIEGQYTNFAKDSFMNTSIAANGTKITKEDTLSGKSFGVTEIVFGHE